MVSSARPIRIGSPTWYRRPGSTTSRSVRVRAPSIIDTFTTAPASRTAQMVAVSDAAARASGRPERPSILRTIDRSSIAGTGAPTAISTWGGSASVRRTDVRPSETISSTALARGGVDSNGWVQRHSRQRATPANPLPAAALPRRTRKTRWTVVRPHRSQNRAADAIAADPGPSASGGGASGGIAAPTPRGGLARRPGRDGAARI